jgi:hypothetical protein
VCDLARWCAEAKGKPDTRVNYGADGSLSRGRGGEKVGEEALLVLEPGLLGVQVLEAGTNPAKVLVHVFQPFVHLIRRQPARRGRRRRLR